jgi:hypothetical protein
MYDEERSLVSEMEKLGKPFALIGVNVNDELGHIQNVVKEKDLNWRSFFAGTDPTIPSSYQIEGYPTVVIIDAEGVVRSAAHGPQNDWIDHLLDEME